MPLFPRFASPLWFAFTLLTPLTPLAPHFPFITEYVTIVSSPQFFSNFLTDSGVGLVSGERR